MIDNKCKDILIIHHVIYQLNMVISIHVVYFIANIVAKVIQVHMCRFDTTVKNGLVFINFTYLFIIYYFHHIGNKMNSLQNSCS